ncbi:hypothetical protein HanXRQr2_Chr16g0774191 [Helianthus annuus]|uniref:Uncharacterized protein n=1 Tax=Helianthus annuus TaxID=4232 RepID=A0A9K3H2F1_HELAN|nr:hypothetical protein HanXRQr2_Chr16g0774191 [Helianthus annuus]
MQELITPIGTYSLHGFHVCPKITSMPHMYHSRKISPWRRDQLSVFWNKHGYGYVTGDCSA